MSVIKSAMRIKLNVNARAGALECEILTDLPCVNLTWKLKQACKTTQLFSVDTP